MWHTIFTWLNEPLIKCQREAKQKKILVPYSHLILWVINFMQKSWAIFCEYLILQFLGQGRIIGVY